MFLSIIDTLVNVRVGETAKFKAMIKASLKYKLATVNKHCNNYTSCLNNYIFDTKTTLSNSFYHHTLFNVFIFKKYYSILYICMYLLCLVFRLSNFSKEEMEKGARNVKEE